MHLDQNRREQRFDEETFIPESCMVVYMVEMCHLVEIQLYW